MSVTPRRCLLVLVALTLVFRLWLSAVFPITGDEAYFIYWGVNPDLGYYDHPPMIGWILAVLIRLSDAAWFLRLPITLLPAGVALIMFSVIRRLRLDGDDTRLAEDRAALAAMGFLILPINVWNIFVTTDTALVLFSFVSGLSFWRAVRSRSQGWFVLAGVMLGLACLSKYFAALLGLAFLAVVIASPWGQRPWRGLLIVYLAALPFIGLNLYWNYQHCWANLMFNLYNRHDDAGWSWRTPLLYAVTVLYTLSPVALIALLRDRSWMARVRGNATLLPFAVLGGLPLLIFAALSVFKQIGLHWVLSFVPFFFAASALVLSHRVLRASAIFLGAFSAIHVAAIIGGSFVPLERWQGNRLYDGIVFHFRINDILRELGKYESEFEIAADGYSAAVTASYYRGRYVFVFGEASSHARHDDLVTDFRALSGRNIAIFRKSPPQEADYTPYFRSIETRSFEVAGAKYFVVLGREFEYPTYRDRVLTKVRDRYYAMPRYLPKGHCDFCERNFDGQACPVR